ncbi:EamA family transporter [Mycolicibacterium mucogenicum]|uniref:EamA family transporter n=1 Tax=Mycolicibacterium mucogenicum TaxID=56689 RepID=UPI000769D68C|nr:EamA family transporter [Mycolicibacterium mucogenicum]
MKHRDLPRWSVPFVFVTGAASQYLGAAIGVFLFSTTQPATVAWLRAAAGALVLAAWRRPWRMRLTRRRITIATLFGLITVGMNIAFYEALARIPLGTAVAVEFIGPTLVATLGSRRPRDLLAAGLAAGGVALLAGIEFTSELAGVAWALAAAALWAGYILVGKRVADAHGGLDALALGMSTAAVIFAPIIIGLQAHTNAAVFFDARTWLLGLGVGLLSTAIPYGLDQVVLRQVGQARFAILLALLPVTATIIGLTVLHQVPGIGEITGIGLVVAGLLLGARGGR